MAPEQKFPRHPKFSNPDDELAYWEDEVKRLEAKQADRGRRDAERKAALREKVMKPSRLAKGLAKTSKQNPSRRPR